MQADAVVLGTGPPKRTGPATVVKDLVVSGRHAHVTRGVGPGGALTDPLYRCALCQGDLSSEHGPEAEYE